MLQYFLLTSLALCVKKQALALRRGTNNQKLAGISRVRGALAWAVAALHLPYPHLDTAWN
jgi:hypothetical protein